MKFLMKFVFVLFVMISACKPFQFSKTLGETNTSSVYIPLDPLPVSERDGRSCCSGSQESGCTTSYKDLLKSFPDMAVRLAITKTSGKASGSYGPVAIGYKGQTFQVILDYINVDVSRVAVYVKKTVVSKDEKGAEKKEQISFYSETDKPVEYSVYPGPDLSSKSVELQGDPDKGDLVVVPVYIGVGLRLTASIVVTGGEVDLSGLAGIAAAAEAEKITGTLTVQTLGISGGKISAGLPLPSEINETTIQNAILAVGSMKAVLDDSDNVEIEPRVVGIYSPFGGNKEMVDRVVSVLATHPTVWYRPCKRP